MTLLRTLLYFLPLLSFFATFQTALAATPQYVEATNSDGQAVWLLDDRKPALYTANYGDCMGGSLLNVTRFDAAYYKDNMTVLFHLAGGTQLQNESLMMYIGVYAYGENRFDLTFNPCNANIDSLCPVTASIPFEANGIIPVSQNDVANIPAIALTIPDFEGEAILRVFANSTQTQIGCFSAVVTNGASFSQPASVGSVLGIFAAVAIVASFATAAYGENIPVMRKHYAHSLSVLVVFAVFHHIFFTGALSMNWPSVLVAFWSNYAWAGGMIYTPSMQNAINKFVGNNRGNTTSVGAASVGSENDGLGGGYDIHQIYGRGLEGVSVSGLMKRSKYNLVAKRLENMLSKRTLANSTDGFQWYGTAVGAGLPLPGNYSGFAGTLAQEQIPASNAFLTGFLWLLILIAIVAGSLVTFKFTLEFLSRAKLIRQDRLTFFRVRWVDYTRLAVLRTLYISFFVMMFLTIFQFTYNGAAGMIALAAIVFVAFFVGMIAICTYACLYRTRVSNHVSESDRVDMERRKVLGFIPWFPPSRPGEQLNQADKTRAGSFPFWRVTPANKSTGKSIHEDEDYTMKYGWLASRFRANRWWFFVAWAFYEFVRACFYGGASGHPLVQVFGLLVVEIIAFIAIVLAKPFEGQRLNALLVYCLGFSKVVTVALSAAFDVRFNLARITTTAIGIVIIVIQGILTIILMIAIFVGAISSYMSVMRNREDFRPRKWINLRTRYFRHLDGLGKEVVVTPAPEPVVRKGPYFNVSSVRRMAKIEDEDADFIAEIQNDPRVSIISLNPLASRPQSVGDMIPSRASRAASVHSNRSSTNLPFGARVHRTSWSSREFGEWSPNSHRRTTISSTAPIVEDARRASANLSINTRYMTSRESVARIPSPLASRPHTPPDLPLTNLQVAKHRASGIADLSSPLSAPASMSTLAVRPPLSTLPSEEHVEQLPKSEEGSSPYSTP